MTQIFLRHGKEYQAPNLSYQLSKYDDYFIQESMFFKGIKLCIPRIFMRVNLIEEKYCGGLVRQFCIDKTLSFLKDKYYW